MVKKLLSSLLPPHITRLQLPDHPNTPIELKRTHRKKTIAFRVANNRIKITAPKRLALYRIQQLLHKRSEWIGKQLEYQATLPAEPEDLIRQYIDGESLKYLGRKYRLNISTTLNTVRTVKLRSGHLQVTLPSGRQSRDEIKSAIAQWYQQRAEERLPEIVAQLSTKIGVD